MPTGSTIRHTSHRTRRIRAASTLEALVAFTLLSGVIALATPLLVRHSRLLDSHRDYQLALEELSNQLDRLTALSDADLADAIKQLAPSAHAEVGLPKAELRGELSPAESGQHLTLRLTWEGPEGRTAPVALAAWVYAEKRDSDSETEGENP